MLHNIVKVPNIELLKTQDSNKENFNANEIQLLLNANNIPLFYQNLIKIGLYTGLRINEIYKIQANNIQVIDNILCINFKDNKKTTNENEKLKNSNAYRIIPVHSKIIDILTIEFIKELQSYSFTYISMNVNKHIKEIITNSKIGKKTFHTLRANFQAVLVNSPQVNLIYAKKIIGHSQGENALTVDIYAKSIDVENLKDTIELVKYSLPVVKHKKEFMII